MARLAQIPLVDEVAQVAHGRNEAVSEGRHVAQARRIGSPGHGASLLCCHGDGLLAEDVLAGCDGRHGDGEVQEVGCGDDDRVDVVPGQ